MENPADEDSDNQDAAGGGGGVQMDQLRGYFNFAKFALRKRWKTTVAALLIGLGLTIPISIYFPRTFSCTTVLMGGSSGVLDARDTPPALVGASDLILRHENLEHIIRDIGLVKKFEARRSPLLLLKDRIVRSLAGPTPEKLQIASLVGTMETKIEVTVEKGDMTVKVGWSDAQTAMELAAAARDSFLKARHTAETSAFEEKMAILDGHSAKLRDEITVLAEQLKAVRDKKLGEVQEKRREASKSQKAEIAAEQNDLARSIPVQRTAEPDAQTPELKARLDALHARLAAAESDRDLRLRAAQAKLEDMKLKLTPSHPEVVAQEQQVAMLSATSSDLALMRAEAKDLEAELRQRGGLGASSSALATGSMRLKTAADDLLPPDVTELLSRDNLDPGLSAQLTSTVIKYGALRDDLLTTRVELDTAEAAFNHRYQVIIPAEAPTKPEKPKPGLIIGAGLFLTLLLAIFLPVFVELRNGVIVERWQVQHLELPVLAELNLPPYSPD